MTPIEHRVAAALNGQDDASPWESLSRLFERDREAFFLLACLTEVGDLSGRTRQLAEYAAFLRRAVRETYQIESSDRGASITVATGESRAIPSELTQEIAVLLRRIDGKETTETPGKDYEGRVISEAEACFKLGDPSTWDKAAEDLRKRREAKPLVLRVPQDELDSLSMQPAYVTYELLHCARSSVLAPTSVFKGLKRGEGGPAGVNKGWAFCGKPRHAYDNQGRPFAVPAQLVHVVYASADGEVFDWDWVREDPGDQGYPIDWRLRFDEPVQLAQEAVLDLPADLAPGTFNATVACYSRRGDCIFCYMSDVVSRADRINSDLTVFYALANDEITGFKVKNVRRIVEQDKSIVLRDAPRLTVSVDAVLLASLKQHRDPQDARVDIYTIVIRALHRRAPEPLEVRVSDETSILAGS